MNNLTLEIGWAVAWCALFVLLLLLLAYRRASLAVATVVLGLALLAYWFFGAAADWWKIAVSVPVVVLLLLNLRWLRVALITRPFLKKYRRLLPSMSSTEREALDAGTVWWDGELFTGGPNWQKLMSAKAPALTAAEQAFLDGPCEELCGMLDDWDITHQRADLPPEVWAFIKAKGFFAMIIPKS
jgi:acyl-CoA dehydrogenase